MEGRTFRFGHAIVVFLDLGIVAALAVCISSAIGGPILVNPWRELPVGWPAAAALALGLLVLRHRSAGASGFPGDLLRSLAAWWRLKSTRGVLALVVGSRVLLLVIGLFAVGAIGHAMPSGIKPEEELIYMPARWDASWYVGIAAGGYRWQGPDRKNSRLAFFPAFPMTLRSIGRLLHLPQRELPWIWTGVALSTLFLWIGLTYVHRLTELLFDDTTAWRAVALTLAYPFSLFHGQVYTESLFLMACAGAVLYTFKDRPVAAATLGLVAGLTRPTGVLLAVFLAGVLIRRRSAEPGSAEPSASAKATADSPKLDERRRSGSARRLLVVLSPIAGTLIHSWFVWTISGDFLGWVSDQAGWGRGIVNPSDVLAPIATFVSARGIWAYIVAKPYEFLNLAALVFALLTSIVVWRRLGWAAALFVLLSVLGPMRVGGLASMGRYTCVLFPMFIAMATIRRQQVSMAILIAFAALQALLAAFFYTDRPVF